MAGKRGWLLLIVLLWVFVLPAALLAEGPVTAVSAEELATAIARAQPGDTIQVTGGVYFGEITIDKSLILVGLDWPVIDGQNQGTVVHITAPGTSIRGFVIRNSGQSLDQENSGIAVEASDALLENNRFENTLFGIYSRHGHNSTFRNNQITSKDLAVQRRGDPIRIWYSNDVILEGNIITKGRDVVLWYSEGLTIRENQVSDGRYGLHFMYCDDALIENNRLVDNSVGIFMMYSRRATIQENIIANNRGPSGYGIGLKDMDDAIIRNNVLLDNRIGTHLDTSPREVDSIGQFNGNLFAYNDVGVQMSPSVRHNHFSNNSFIENEEQVALIGGGKPGENLWTVAGAGNYWSDYAGYDADNDGRGDMVYKSERLFEDLMQREPNLRLFIYSPATNALDLAARAFPLVRPQPKLVDERPLMTPVIPVLATPTANLRQGGWSALATGLVILAIGFILAIPRWHWRTYQFAVDRVQVATADPVSLNQEIGKL